MKVRSVLYDEASGSIGNITAANSQGGTYFKVKPNPTNPNTANQRAVRDGLSAANSAWTSMTAAVRAEWAGWAGTLTGRNQVGSIITVSAWAAFSGAFVLLAQAGRATAPLLLAAPTTEGYASSGDVTGTYSPDLTTIALSTNTVTDRTAHVFVSAQTKQTINNYGGSYNYTQNGTIASGTDIAVNVEIDDDQRRFVRIQVVEADGRYSKATTIVVDA